MKLITRLMFVLSLMVIYDLAYAADNCPPAIGNVDIFTRIVDFRSKPGEAGSDFAKTVKAMESGGNGRLTGICVEGHSNVKHSDSSTMKEAKRFAGKICRANLTSGVPIYVSGYGNKKPSHEYWINREEEYTQLYNHRIVVKYIYGCPEGLACISPLSGVVLDKKNRVAYGAGVCVDKVEKGMTLRKEAEMSALKAESSAKEMMKTVREMLSRGVTSSEQQRELVKLQTQAKKAFVISYEIKKNLPKVPSILIKPNCPKEE